MFERLYTHPATLALHRTSPLAEERTAYLHHLEHQGLLPSGLCDTAAYLLVITRRLHLADRPGECIDRDEIDRQAALWAARGVGHRKPGQCSRQVFRSHATRWLHFLGRLAPSAKIDKPFAKPIDEFATYLRVEKGLSPITVHCRSLVLHRFLAQLAATDGSLANITIGKIDEMLLAMVKAGGCLRNSVQNYASYLRAFFRYAEGRGWCPKGLASAIQAPRVYSQTALPAGPSWDTVRQLITNMSGDRPSDVRDRAIIMLLAIYGLRAGEVRNLRLDDIDWDHETLRVKSPKSRQDRSLPLSRPVGDAIVRYLQEGRPRSHHRELFLTRQAPIRPLRNINYVVAHRLRPLGLSLPHPGPHALRHACATHLLAEGLSLKEIGDYLGHKSPDATRIYAKVDRAGLRRVVDFDLGGLL